MEAHLKIVAAIIFAIIIYAKFDLIKAREIAKDLAIESAGRGFMSFTEFNNDLHDRKPPKKK